MIAYLPLKAMNPPIRPRFIFSGVRCATLCLMLPALVPQGAMAMCVARSELGFPHAAVRHYPANIRGVLFQAPADGSLSEQDFEISSPDDRHTLRVKLEPVVLPADSAAAHNLPRRARLVRIMANSGFVPGSTYTIRWTAPRVRQPQYPDETTFTIDPAPLDFERGEVSLVMHEAVVRGHVVRTEDTSSGFIAATRRLEMKVAGTLQRYRQAVSFFPEWADVRVYGTPDAFRPLRQTATSCSGETFGAGARDRDDVVYQECYQPLERKAVRGSAAFLELGDHLLALPPLSVNWDAASHAACRSVQSLLLSKQALRNIIDFGLAVPLPEGDRKD